MVHGMHPISFFKVFAMSLQFRFFLIPIMDDGEAENDLNRFLRSVRVVTVNRQFVDNGENSYWSLAVEYLPTDGGRPGTGNGKSNRRKLDYKEILSPEDFALYAKLRDWRKTVADREAVPVYTIFTNDQLAQIAANRISSPAALREIEGIGEARAKKYGDEVISIVSELVKQSCAE